MRRKHLLRLFDAMEGELDVRLDALEKYGENQFKVNVRLDSQLTNHKTVLEDHAQKLDRLQFNMAALSKLLERVERLERRLPPRVLPPAKPPAAPFPELAPPAPKLSKKEARKRWKQTVKAVQNERKGKANSGKAKDPA